jgi:hypothetical protein
MRRQMLGGRLLRLQRELDAMPECDRSRPIRVKVAELQRIYADLFKEEERC